MWKKRTLADLAKDYKKSIPWVRKQLDLYTPIDNQKLIPQAVVIIADALFFKRGDGIFLIRAPELKRNLYAVEITYETVEIYTSSIKHLENKGWSVLAVVCDGRRGVKEQLARAYPVQVCQFHQVATVNRYLTRRPKLEAAIALRAIALTLSNSKEDEFSARLNNWYETWQSFLKEKTINPDTRRWFYTHKRIRSAYFSLKHNLPNLFTFQRYPALNIPNTTNSLDGSISHFRTKLRNHSGTKHFRRKCFTRELLLNLPPK